MYGIIATDELYEEIKEALNDKEIWFEKIGIFNPEIFIQHCKAAANVNLQTLIVDISCSDDQSIRKGIHQYRFTRNTRIIIIAPNREPGDPTISYLVSLGIWDIIAPQIHDEEENGENSEEFEEILVDKLRRMIREPSSYADAARWHSEINVAGLSDNTSEKKQIRKKVINKTNIKQIDFLDDIIDDIPPLRERIIKIPEVIEHPHKVISIVNIHPRAGSKFIATNLARILSKQGFYNGVVEFDLSHPTLYELLFGEIKAPKNYVSWHMQIAKEGIISTEQWKEDKTIWIPVGPEKISSWNKEHTIRLLLYAKQVPILLCVIGCYRNKEVIDEVLKNSDEIWFVAEDSVVMINTYIEEIEKEYLKTFSNKSIIIGNRWTYISKEIEKALKFDVLIKDFGPIAKKAEYEGNLLYDYEEMEIEVFNSMKPLLERIITSKYIQNPEEKRGIFSRFRKKGRVE